MKIRMALVVAAAFVIAFCSRLPRDIAVER